MHFAIVAGLSESGGPRSGPQRQPGIFRHPPEFRSLEETSEFARLPPGESRLTGLGESDDFDGVRLALPR